MSKLYVVYGLSAMAAISKLNVYRLTQYNFVV